MVGIVTSQGHPLLQLTISLVSILKLDPQLPNLHEGKDVRDPLNHERGQLLLVRESLADLQECLQLVSLDPRFSRNHRVLILSSSWQGKLVTSVFVFHKSTSHFQSQVGGVKDLFDMQNVHYGPGVLGEGS